MWRKIKKVLKFNRVIYRLLLRMNNKYFYIKLFLKCRRMVTKRIKAYKNSKNKKIYFLLEQDHGNLGDIAIGYAEKIFIKDNLKNFNAIFILEREYKLLKSYFIRIIKKDDIIALIGGGSIGNEYLEHERSRRDVIMTFPTNKIISFPQTICFIKDKSGDLELNNSAEIYNKHSNLTVIAREKPSYSIMKQVFTKNFVILAPDIVLYLNKTEPREKRAGALCCLRSDKEGILSYSEKTRIFDILSNYFCHVTVTDMDIKRGVTMENRDLEVEEKLKQFKRAEVVITDRLHGMIFAAITATPCIALSNYNYKITGSYSWIRHLGYIKFAYGLEDLLGLIKELKNMKNCRYSNSYAIPYYKNIIDSILLDRF